MLMQISELVSDLAPYVLALVFAAVLARLATFTACAGIPPGFDDAEREARSLAENNEALKRKQERLDELTEELKTAKLVGPLGKFVSKLNPFQTTVRPEEDIQRDIDVLLSKIKDEITENESGRDLVVKIKKLGNEAKRTQQKLENARQPTGDSKKLGLKSTVPGLPAESSQLIGLAEFATRLDTALEKAEPIIGAKVEQIETILARIEPLFAAFDDASAALEQVMAPEADFDAIVDGFNRMDAASEFLAQVCFEFVLMDFVDGFFEIDALAEFLQTDPPLSALVARRDSAEGGVADGDVVQLEGEIELDGHLFTEIRSGDTIVIELPRGYRLTAPLEIDCPDSITVAVGGNTAGSCAVSIEVIDYSENDDDPLRVRVDQPIALSSDACGTSDLRIWNLDRAHGLAIPVTTITRGAGSDGAPVRRTTRP